MVRHARKVHDKNSRGSGGNRPLVDDAPLPVQSAAEQWVSYEAYGNDKLYPREVNVLIGEPEVPSVFGTTTGHTISRVSPLGGVPYQAGPLIGTGLCDSLFSGIVFVSVSVT